MTEFFLLFITRILSGAQNGFGYAKKPVGRILSGIGLLILCFAPLLLSTSVGAIIMCIVSAVALFGIEDSFNHKINVLPGDIHFWEYIFMGLVFTAWAVAGGNLIAMACSVYPALIIHKGIINLSVNLPFLATKTDDPTGHTFSVPLLGVVVVRSGNQWRLFWAGMSLVVLVAMFIFGWKVTVVPLVVSI